MKTLLTCFLLLLRNNLINGLETQNKQRNNPNTDFLLHEASAVPFGQPKRDFVASAPSSNVANTPTGDHRQHPSEKLDFDSQFPPLSGTHTTHRPTGKRDYVAPNTSSRTTASTSSQVQNQQNSPGNHNFNSQFLSVNNPTTKTLTQTTSRPSGKRDYVAPYRNNANTPAGGRNPGNQNFDSSYPPLNSQTTKSTGRRDYVAPNYSTASPVSTINNSKVKDLINFYDSQNKDQNSNRNGPSYSSILQNTNNKKENILPNPSYRPNVVQPTSSSNNPGTTNTAVTTKNPSTVVPQRPSSRPSTPVLPSSIVANNQNQGTNGAQVSDDEIKNLSEELLRKDVNNAAKYVTVNYQEKTTASSKEDKAPLPLLSVAPAAWNIPTIVKFLPLLDNYERDTLVNEHVTPQERNEENAFMDAIMSTTVIRHLMNFFKEKGYITPDPKQQRDFLKQLWFSLYSRGKGKISSSGFEHIFVSELKNGEVSGLHNWIYFSKEESANRVNYLGYLKYLPFNDKGVVMKLHFNQLGVDKPVDTMFIGTSPELEIALYTLCFVTRADSDCNLKLGNKDVSIVTHTFRYRSKNLIGSAYPQF